MSDTPESLDPDTKKEGANASLLDEIIQMKKSEDAPVVPSETTSVGDTTPAAPLPKKPREPISF